MGIESFYGRYIKKNYRGIVENKVPGKVASLFIDCNGIFHSSAQVVYGYGEHKGKGEKSPDNNKLSRTIITKLKEIVGKCKPKYNLILAPDGVATAAKMNQQKGRRYNAAKTKEAAFDSNQFTPGTDLMIQLDTEINKWLKRKNTKLPERVIYSSHLDEGEGEHKIFQFIREDKLIPGEGAHVLYGLDSDLIILSLLCDLPGIYLMREDYTELINIDTLRKKVKEKFRFVGADEDRIIKDFSIICMFAGNDFLPKLPSYTDIGSFLALFTDYYKSNKKHIIDDDDDIDFAVLKDIFSKFRKIEQTLLVSIIVENKHKFPYPELKKCVDVKNQVLDTQRFTNLWYCKQFCPASGRLAALYPNHAYYNEVEVGNMVIAFLKTCQWVYKYYTSGFKSVSNTHFYPYLYTPFGESIYSILDQIYTQSDKREARLYKLHDIGASENIEITAGHQLLSVIPPQSAGLIIPNELKQAYSALSMISPIDFSVKHEGTNTDWHVTVVIPPVNIKIVNAALTHTNTSVPDRLKGKTFQTIDTKERGVVKTTSYKIQDVQLL